MKQGNHGNHDGTGIDRKLHNPVEDRLIPLESLDLNRVHSVDDLVRAMAKTAFTGRQVGEAADVLEAMATRRGLFRGHDLGRLHDRGQTKSDHCRID